MASRAVLQACRGGCVEARQRLAELKGWRDDADIAIAAYHRPASAAGDAAWPPRRLGGKTLVTSREDLAKAGLTPADLEIPGTNFGAVVYREGEPPGYVVGFRGTEEWLGSDMGTNIDQAFDRPANAAPNSYYSRAQSIARRLELAQQKTGGPPARFVGHSLGGGLASAAAACVGGPATTFNAAGLNPATVVGGRSGGAVNAIFVKGEALHQIQEAPGLSRAYNTRQIGLDPPLDLARDLLAPAVGALAGVAGPWWGVGGVALARAMRAGLLHTTKSVNDSLDRAIGEAGKDVKAACGT